MRVSLSDSMFKLELKSESLSCFLNFIEDCSLHLACLTDSCEELSLAWGCALPLHRHFVDDDLGPRFAAWLHEVLGRFQCHILGSLSIAVLFT